MSKMKSQSGFGLLEVIVAAVVFSFLFIGLNVLQKGNREGVLRIRARDVANVIAQDVIDSISSLGFSSIRTEIRTGICPTPSNPNGENLDLCRTRVFDGGAGSMKTDYSIKVNVTEDQSQKVGGAVNLDYLTSDYIAANSSGSNALKVERMFAKRVEVTVNWEFKKAPQSINVSAVIR